MGFSSGSVSFRRFSVIGTAPPTATQELLDALAQNALRENEGGLPEETDYGWGGGRHVFDAEFSFEHNVFADCLSFALRIDTNKVPPATKKAWLHIEEEALAKNNPSGFISKNQRREAKDAVRRQVEEAIRAGKFRKSRLVPILWDLSTQTIHAVAAGATFERLFEIFERTFKCELRPISSGSIAWVICDGIGRRRDFEDLKPTRFIMGPEGESHFPDYPWVSKCLNPKDFLGNEFLLWLWYTSASGVHDVGFIDKSTEVFIDKGIDLECAFGQTGKDAIRGDEVSRSPESMDALRVGKLPRKFGLIFSANKQQYSMTIGAESLAVAGVRLPDVEDADSPRVLFEERIGFVRDLCKAIDGMLGDFIKIRTSAEWEPAVLRIRRWIMRRSEPGGVAIPDPIVKGLEKIVPDEDREDDGGEARHDRFHRIGTEDSV